MRQKLSEFVCETNNSPATEALFKENNLDINDSNIWEYFPDLKNNFYSLYHVCCNLPKITNIEEAADIIKRNISSKHFCIMGDYDKQI